MLTYGLYRVVDILENELHFQVIDRPISRNNIISHRAYIG